MNPNRDLFTSLIVGMCIPPALRNSTSRIRVEIVLTLDIF